MKDWRLVVEVSARVEWVEAPKSTHEKITRQMENHRVLALAKALTPEVRQILLDKIEQTRRDAGA